MARKRHPKKEVEDALQYAEAHGWTVTDTASGHRWGVAVCWRLHAADFDLVDAARAGEPRTADPPQRGPLPTRRR